MTVGIGIHSLPAAEYHADPCVEPSLSASIAAILCARSPRHAWTAHPRLNPNYVRKDDAKYDIGTAAHAVLLEGKPFDHVVHVVDADSWRTNAAKDERDRARAIGFIPLLTTVVDDVRNMVDMANSQLDALDTDRRPFAGGRAEQTLVWTDGVPGGPDITCRAMVDWLHDDRLVIDDLKTTSTSANPYTWPRTAFNIGADVQTAFHLRGLAAVSDPSPVAREMRYIVIETEPPHALSVMSFTPAALAVGHAKTMYAIRRWSECLASDVWPGYPNRVTYVDPPAWEETRWLEREAVEGLEDA